MKVRPAPPTAQEPLDEADFQDGAGGGGMGDMLNFGDQPNGGMPDGSDFPDWNDLKKKMGSEAPVEHDEL